MALKCTNTSSPVSWAMNPYPFVALNHLTVPVDVDIMRLSFLRWTSVGRANGVLLYERATNRLEAEERLYLLDFRGRTDPDGWDRAYDNTGRFRMQEDSEKIFRKKRVAGTSVTA